MAAWTIQLGAEFKASAKFLDHSIINGKEQRLLSQRLRDSLDYLGDGDVIPGGVVIGIRLKGIVKGVERGVGKP